MSEITAITYSSDRQLQKELGDKFPWPCKVVGHSIHENISEVIVTDAGWAFLKKPINKTFAIYEDEEEQSKEEVHFWGVRENSCEVVGLVFDMHDGLADPKECGSFSHYEESPRFDEVK